MQHLVYDKAGQCPVFFIRVTLVLPLLRNTFEKVWNMGTCRLESVLDSWNEASIFFFFFIHWGTGMPWFGCDDPLMICCSFTSVPEDIQMIQVNCRQWCANLRGWVPVFYMPISALLDGCVMVSGCCDVYIYRWKQIVWTFVPVVSNIPSGFSQ